MNDTTAIANYIQEEGQDLLHMVGFTLAGEFFGVDILMVQEIIKRPRITPIPDSPAFIEGVINLRGRIIPIIDLRNRFGLPIDEKTNGVDTWTLILNIGERVAGFTVDRVTRVVKVPLDAIEPRPEVVASASQSQYIKGICKLDGQPMAILDFNRILVVEEFKKHAERKHLEA